MLEGLPAVDWSALTHAYGPADDVPDMIRALASPDPELWVAALSGLYDTLCHQTCTVYEATPPAIPFLVELLTDSRVRCRGRILQFLGDTARATSYLAAHGDMPHFQQKRATDEFQRQLAEELEWVRRTREAIWAGVDHYLDLLTDLDKRVRVTAPYTIGLLAGYASEEVPDRLRRPELFATIAARMISHFEEEPNDFVRASLTFGLCRYAPHRPEVSQFLERLVSDPTAERVTRMSAALGLAGLSETFSPAVLDVLLDGLERRAETDRLFDTGEAGMEGKHHPLAKAYREAGSPLDEESGTGPDPADVGRDEDFSFPWLTGWPSSMILNRLDRPHADYTDRVVPLVVPYLDAATPYTIESVARPVLRMAFGDPTVPPRPVQAPLTPAQIQVLRPIYFNLSLWATDIGNGSALFSRFGLPGRRVGWAELLGIEEGPLSDTDIKAILARLAPAQQFIGTGPHIRRLNLREIGTPAFVKHLDQFPELEELDLCGVRLEDDHLAHLLRLPRLRKLHISGARITDAGAEVLSRLSNLQDLNVSGARLTDAGLNALGRLKNLVMLMIHKVPVSAEAVRRFQAARPACKVWQ